MRVGILLWLALLLHSTSAGAGDVKKLEFQGLDRLYRIHNAEAARDGAAPLLIHLHGYRKREEAEAGRETLDYIAWSELEATAEKHGFIVAQPAAYIGQWSLFPGLKKAELASGEEIDDVRFIFAVADKLVRDGIADSNRIYLTGISDGAIMSYRLLCEPQSPFAAAVPVVGSMYEKHMADCTPARPAPIMVIAGTNDRILPYDGWLFRTGREASIPETLEHWRLQHGCKGQKSELLKDRDPEDNSRVLSVVWTECARDGAVKLLRVEGGGHAVPSFTPVSESWRERGGGHNRDIESAEEVWRFVKEFDRGG